METEDMRLKASWDLYEMIEAFMMAPKYHLLFEAALIIWILRLLFIKSYRVHHKPDLTEKEKEELIAEWQPEPLVPEINDNDPVLVNMRERLVDSKIGKYMIINGKKCLNMATTDFLSMIDRPEIEDVSVTALRKYGVGSCGPRGFYGTVDAHIQLEEKIAKFMKCEEAIIYSYGFAAVSSAIPAYSKRGDVIFVDEGVHFAVQQGLKASRSVIKYFHHNDMNHLEKLLEEQAKDDVRNPKKAKITRRFLVAEGLYAKYGDICPLPKLVELKWKYKLRLFIDETFSFGVLGKTGRGVTEHFNISVDEVDQICGSLETVLGTVGGFCCGSSFVIDHQRLSGLGYCFSASAPPMLAKAASAALDIVENNQDLTSQLQNRSSYIHKKLEGIKELKVLGAEISPLKHLVLANEQGKSRAECKAVLACLVEEVEKKGIALTMAAYLDEEEHVLTPPSIRLCVKYNLSDGELDEVVSVIKESIKIVGCY